MAILGSPYRGRKAVTYEMKRRDARKWRDEDTTIAQMLASIGSSEPNVAAGTLLDVAAGTGRFFEHYYRAGLAVVAVDISQDMLDIAKKRTRTDLTTLEIGDATELRFADCEFDVVVCVRLLHLLPEQQMRKVVTEICRVASSHVILTIQLGPEYRAGHDTATHNERKFRGLIRRLGWCTVDDRRLTAAGWHIMRLER